MNVLGVIPARGGSKTIPRKNLVNLRGRPLLAYTCEAARASRHLGRVILSTDDPEIAALGRELRIEVPFMRPPALGDDASPMLDVLQHAVRELAAQDAYVPDVVVLLQPTSPLRRAEHIDAVIDLLVAGQADSIVGVVEVPHQFNPVSVLRLREERLEPFLDGPTVTRRQDKPVTFARNGPAVLAVRRDVLLGGSLYGEDCRPYIMAPEDSIDIDTALDLELAEWLLARRERANSKPLVGRA